MSDAVSCPTCGAPVSGDARHCTYCHGPVATVRCGGCFHSNLPSAVHCAACGKELGLEPILEPAVVTCPNCARSLAVFRAELGKLYDCGECGGQLVEHALLHELLERREICGASVPRRALAHPTSATAVRYVPCPMCRALMNRHNFGGTSGVVVDVCRDHGVWFDAGELPRVLEFVESGGLARARRRQIEELDRARRDRELSAEFPKPEEGAAQTALHKIGPLALSGSMGFSSPPAWKTGLWKDAKEAVTELLSELGDLIERR